MGKNILILTGGPKKKLDAFDDASRLLNLDVKTASFYDIEYFSINNNNSFVLKLNGHDLAEFDTIYLRVIGKRLEDATLVVNYAKEKGIKIVDRVYEDALFIPSSISKGMEMKKLIEAGIPLPKTFFGSLSAIRDKATNFLGMPFVIKSTSGKKARDAWFIEGKEKLDELVDELREREKGGTRFFAQEFVRASQRVRVLVIGDKVVGAITRPTKWRKKIVTQVEREHSEGEREAVYPVPQKYSELALKAANAAELGIAGIDILEEDKTGKLYVIEANAAPSWNLIKKDCGVDIEEEILKFLALL